MVTLHTIGMCLSSILCQVWLRSSSGHCSHIVPVLLAHTYIHTTSITIFRGTGATPCCTGKMLTNRLYIQTKPYNTRPPRNGPDTHVANTRSWFQCLGRLLLPRGVFFFSFQIRSKPSLITPPSRPPVGGHMPSTFIVNALDWVQHNIPTGSSTFVDVWLMFDRCLAEVWSSFVNFGQFSSIFIDFRRLSSISKIFVDFREPEITEPSFWCSAHWFEPRPPPPASSMNEMSARNTRKPSAAFCGCDKYRT